MSIVSQAAIVLLIVLTIAIIAYANKGLRYAQEEGEHFVDEWALKQAKIEEQKKRIAREKARSKENHLQRKAIQTERAGRNPVSRDVMHRNEIPKNEPVKIISRYRLTVRDEEKKVVGMADVDHYPFTIGRDRSNDLVLDDIYVARKHCVILEENGQTILKNQGSQNGIYVGGKQVDTYLLQKDGHFYIGTYEIIVSETGHRSQPTMVVPDREKAAI